MSGLERMRAVYSMFKARRAMLEMRYNDTVEVLRHIHGNSISEADYAAIGCMLRGAAA